MAVGATDAVGVGVSPICDLRKVAESKRAQCCDAIVAGPRVDWLCTATGGSRNPLLPALHHQYAAIIEMSDDVMGRSVNWSRIKSRDRMRKQGVEDIKGETPLVGQPKPRRKLSKAELREHAEAAFVVWREGQTVKDK